MKKLWFIVVAVFCGCGDKKLTIEPIGWGIYHVTDSPCIERQYYTIANYEHIAPDSLYSVLKAYINSISPYEKIVENIKHNPFCDFKVFFYEKSLFANYEKYLSSYAIRSEMGSIDEYRHKLVAKIYVFGGDNSVFNTVLYDNNKYNNGEVYITLKKTDTVEVK